jgi:hypothetical protein
VDSCETRDGKLIIRYSGINKGQFEQLDPFTGILFFINSDERTNLMGVASVPGMTYEYAGVDRYKVAMPLVTGEQIANVGIVAKKCEEDFDKIKAMVKCEQPGAKPTPAPTAPAAPETSEETPEATEEAETVIEPVSVTEERVEAVETAEAAPAEPVKKATVPETAPETKDDRAKVTITLPDTTTLVLIGVIATLVFVIVVMAIRRRGKEKKVVVVEEKKGKK